MATDNTRDIVIETKTKVEAMEKSLAEMAIGINDLKNDLQQRRGAEKVARAIHAILGGTIGAGVIKGISWLGALPK